MLRMQVMETVREVRVDAWAVVRFDRMAKGVR